MMLSRAGKQFPGRHHGDLLPPEFVCFVPKGAQGSFMGMTDSQGCSLNFSTAPELSELRANGAFRLLVVQEDIPTQEGKLHFPCQAGGNAPGAGIAVDEVQLSLLGFLDDGSHYSGIFRKV